MKCRYLAVFYLLIISGCGNKDQLPADIIPPDKMQAIVWDLMRADQFQSQFVFNKDSTLNKKTERINIYKKIFEIHHTDRDNFRKSYAYYKSNLPLFKALMDSLSQQPKDVSSSIISNPASPDSIKKKKLFISPKDSLPEINSRKTLPVQ